MGAMFLEYYNRVVAELSIPYMGFRRKLDEYRKRLKELRKEMNEREKKLREHYEKLLRESAIRNSIMVALYNAWKEGKLGKCYRDGGEPTVLADGTLLCRMPEESKSYVIAIEEAEEEGEEE